MRIALGHRLRPVPQKLLHSFEGHAPHNEMRCKSMPKRMLTDYLKMAAPEDTIDRVATGTVYARTTLANYKRPL